MRFRAWVHDWSGVLLVMIVGLATTWLAVDGQLRWYIHPRYEMFAVLLAVAGLVCSVAAICIVPTRQRATVRVGFSSVVLVGLVAIAALGFRPATLTTATVSQRIMNSGGALDSGLNDSDLLKERGDYAHFTVKDWAQLLAQSDDPMLYSQKTVRLTGFVAPSERDETIFYVSRFSVTCCAVDARPIGVPVYKPGWRQVVSADDWVEVSGVMAANPLSSSKHRTVVAPDYVKKITQTGDPYVY